MGLRRLQLLPHLLITLVLVRQALLREQNLAGLGMR